MALSRLGNFLVSKRQRLCPPLGSSPGSMLARKGPLNPTGTLLMLSRDISVCEPGGVVGASAMVCRTGKKKNQEENQIRCIPGCTLLK